MKKIIFFLLVWQSVAAFAQWSDNFNDGVFRSENRSVNWNGDVAEFTVNESLQLQLNSSANHSPSQLRTSSTLVQNTSWEFYVKMDFNPTASNYVKVYLASDEENLTDELNGLFIRIGYTDKNICLMQSKKGSNNKTLISGEKKRLDLTTVGVHIKATLNNAGKLNLYSKLQGETDFTPEGSCDIADVPASGWFGVVCTFTSTRSKAMAFDDFIVRPLRDDEQETEPGEKLQKGDVLINEILFNPPTGGNEYVEIYNHSAQAIDLRFLSMATRKASDGTLNKLYPLAGAERLLEPGKYAVITKHQDLVCSFFTCHPESDFIELSVMPALANASGCVVMVDNRSNEIIDEFAYAESMHSKELKSKKGVALERVRFDVPAENSANWLSASTESGYGTPGYVNSQHQGTGIQEIAESSIRVEYPAFNGDSYGIRYHLDRAGYNCRLFIYDSLGRLVSTLANNTLLGSQGVIHWNGDSDSARKLTSGVYIIYMEVFDSSGNMHKFKTPVVVK